MIINSSQKQFNKDEKGITIPRPISIIVNTFDEVSVREFRILFQEAIDIGQEYIPVYIDSGGGYVASAFAMIDMIKKSPVPVVTIANGFCMSAGALLLSAGTEGYRYSGPLTQLMLHDASAGAFGKEEEIVNFAKYIEQLQEQIYISFDTNCNKKPGFYKKYFKNGRNLDLYISANEALKLGLINYIGLPNFEYNIEYSLKIKDSTIQEQPNNLLLS